MTSTDSHTWVTTTWIVIGNAVLGRSLCSITKPFFHFPMGPDNSLINFVHWFLSYIASVYSLVKRDTVSLFPGLREIRRHVRTDIHSYSYWTLSTKLMQITPCIMWYSLFVFKMLWWIKRHVHIQYWSLLCVIRQVHGVNMIQWSFTELDCVLVLFSRG